MTDLIFVGKGEQSPQNLLARFANRHGLIAGATGTGKTVTLQRLAEGFSDLGVPVFAVDIKGDLSGIAAPGEAKPRIAERIAAIGLDWSPQAYPTVFWDVFGIAGHPVRATVSDLGPTLLARLLELSDVQEAVLSLVFKYADDNGLLLLDVKDLRAALQHVADNADSLGIDYGLVGAASVGAIQRGLLQLQGDGAEQFFGEPALELEDLMRQDFGGRGVINLLAAEALYQRPRLYATFLLWLLSELFERLPEQGDAEKPRLVFFFDEAHLLFTDAPKALVAKVEQVVRLIRSKGVGVYFITQNPIDLPDSVLGQLGNRVQHALRAFTPRDFKAVKVAAETFRPNPQLDVESAISTLGVGEALVSTLQEGGVPGMVEKTLIAPPRSRIGPLSVEERRVVMSRSPVGAKYAQAFDRESAYERLAVRAMPAPVPSAPPPEALPRDDGGKRGRRGDRPPKERGGGRRNDSFGESMAKSVARGAATSLGRQVVNGLLRGLLGSLRKR